MKKHIKPPLGVLHKKLYDEFLMDDIILNGGMCPKYIKDKRLKDLKGAIIRYSSFPFTASPEWIVEYYSLYFKKENY